MIVLCKSSRYVPIRYTMYYRRIRGLPARLNDACYVFYFSKDVDCAFFTPTHRHRTAESAGPPWRVIVASPCVVVFFRPSARRKPRGLLCPIKACSFRPTRRPSGTSEDAFEQTRTSSYRLGRLKISRRTTDAEDVFFSTDSSQSPIEVNHELQQRRRY